MDLGAETLEFFSHFMEGTGVRRVTGLRSHSEAVTEPGRVHLPGPRLGPHCPAQVALVPTVTGTFAQAPPILCQRGGVSGPWERRPNVKYKHM